MKSMKKIASVVLALVMAMAMMVPAFATQEGKGSITITNAAKGETYKLVKLFDMTFDNEKNAYAYTGTIPAELAAYFAYKTDDDGNTTENIIVTDAAKDAEGNLSSAAVLAIKKWAKDQEGTSETANGESLVFDDLDYGYYVVVSRSEKSDNDENIPGGAVSVTSTTPDAKIVDKNEGDPHFPNDGGKTVDKKVVQVGETVKYTVTYITVNWYGTEPGAEQEQVINYIVTDTLPDFLDNVTVTSIKVGGEDIGVQQFDRENGNKITLPWADCKDDGEGHEHSDECEWTSRYDNGAVIEIVYTATVNEKVLGAAEENHKNVVTVTCETTKSTTDDKDDEDVYTATIVINKYEKGDETKTLAGAEFALKNEDGKYYAWVEAVEADDPETEDINEAVNHVEWVDSVDDATKVVTDATGAAKIEGLKLGTYYLEETKAPAGYNKLASDVTVEIKVSETDENAVATANITQTADVENSTGALLPSTGGIGTTIFYVVGGILVVAAVILLVTRKRMSE